MTTTNPTPQVKVKDEPGKQVFLCEDKAIFFVTIEHDEDCPNPLEDCDGMGHILSLNRRHRNFKPEDIERLLAERPDDVVPLSYYEHGLCLWDVQDGARIRNCPDMRWDGVSFAGIWYPDQSLLDMANDEKTSEARRAKLVQWASEACKVYTEWCNGNCYAFNAVAYAPMRDKHQEICREQKVYANLSEPMAEDSCCGFIGDDGIQSMISDYIDPLIEQVFAKF